MPAPSMKLVIISDTHGRHEELGTLRGDVLIYCGDSGNGFTRHASDVDRLDDWFGQKELDRILCIGGNHDFEMQARVERGGLVSVTRSKVDVNDSVIKP